MKFKKYSFVLVAAVFILLLTGFYWKTFFKNLSPFPGDMLVGAYYPWLNQKWGYSVGVPVKNPLISDVYSVNYIEKRLIAEAFKNNQLPLWNQYSYSGMPFMANFHSGVFNPFNFLMVVFGDIKGWNWLIICQTLGCLTTMFLFLRILKISYFGSLIGSITYAFSGFAIVWLEYATTGYSLIWLPLLFLFIEKFFQTKKYKFLIPAPLLLFLLMSAGHIQLFCFGSALAAFYFIWKIVLNKDKLNIKPLLFFLTTYLIGAGLMAVQILPTLELSSNSIRYGENFIQSFNFGLQPVGKIVTLIAPDFFGNPTTFNYWGFFDYNETILYIGIIGLMSLIFAIYNFKKLGNEKFFVVFSIISLLLVTNNPIGKLIYILKIPAISTSAAGRATIIFTFCVAVLTAVFIEKLKTIKFKNFFKYYWGLFLFIAILFLIIFSTKYFIKDQTLINHLKISFRNMVLPSLLLFASSCAILFFKNKNISKTILLLIIVFDLFRFGWKYTPFVKENIIYPNTPLIDYLQQQPGFFRVEKERGALLPPNTWAAYRLSSTSGYEPMALDKYANYYNQTLNNAPNWANSSRYSELDYFNAKELGEANVKYLVAFKYDEKLKISPDGKFLNPKINSKDWKKVFEENNIVLLENQQFKPRVEMLNDNSDSKVEITNYGINQIDINYNSKTSNNILLTNSWDSGWTAKINSKNIPVDIYNKTFMSISVPAGNNLVNLVYQPKSFQIGKTITYISLSLYLILSLILLIKNK